MLSATVVTVLLRAYLVELASEYTLEVLSMGAHHSCIMCCAGQVYCSMDWVSLIC